MMTFILISSALIALALVLLLIPFIRRDASIDEGDQRLEQNIGIAREKKLQLAAQLEKNDITHAAYEAELTDLERSLAFDIEKTDHIDSNQNGRWMVVFIALVLPVCSAVLYWNYGAYQVIENPQLAQARKPEAVVTAPDMSLDEMIVAVKKKLKENPDDARGWFALGKTLMAKQEFEQGLAAFERTNELAPNEPGVLFSLADAMAIVNDGMIEDATLGLINLGLSIDPLNPSGLWLAGLAEEQRGNFKKAHQYWVDLLPIISNDPESSYEVRSLIAMMEERDPEITKFEENLLPADFVSVVLQVDINEELRSNSDPDDAVFVYAKAMSGPPMPLAVQRIKVSDLPVEIRLSDIDAMIPNMKLSLFEQVIVGARVSKSGQPVAQPGDYFIEVESVDVDSQNNTDSIQLLINQVKQ
ncbi:MAG: cytochrome c-type biogenesis protein CcmH [Gammaproteobacteria bacterium]|jgi:cytochrome c-type biogenesis protein CcmH